ncbi:hypothetical protein J7337_000406 [Fusarium musae]|uniref:Uncharacterized protein n=1 Tax=Fusarium musae TaxID=1042133 RepID=A0A9P8DS55_9HYPO|nr:hypothetical protein J7337_000406 [Fusarium musae]KAG9506862.1 hypothetical protein J7337_000406 [Fusarium musae]
MSTKTKGCSGHSWGFIAPDVQDPPLCISLCRERFLKELVPGDETIERVCEVLQDRDWMEKEQPFRALYCCDAQACGVDNLGEGGKDRMPLGVKVTIAIISVVGLLAIAALIFCLLRRRRSRKTDIRRLIKHPSSPPPRADSPTPLVSPTISHTDPDGVPLTPPARLRERRFLADEPNGFPTSPVYSPTSSKLSPRHERTPRIYSANQVPMIVMTAPDGGKVRDDGSLSFSDGIITPPPSALIAPLGYNTQTSPPRPPRSRDASFNMLASPGPPPTRALPSTPPYRPSTPTSPPGKGTMPL